MPARTRRHYSGHDSTGNLPQMCVTAKREAKEAAAEAHLEESGASAAVANTEAAAIVEAAAQAASVSSFLRCF